MCAVVLVLLSTTAQGDPVPTQSARDRPRVGWICARWTERMRADVNGDGRVDRILSYVRTAPNSTCDESALPPRWWITVFMGTAGRIDREVRCDSSSLICFVAVVDLDDDGVFELVVHTDGGAALDEATVLRAVMGRLWRLRTPDGRPFELTFATDSGTRQGWGCRTHPGGAPVVVTYLGRPQGRSAGRWRFVIERWRTEGAVVRRIGGHVRLVRTPGDWPSTPHVERCSSRGQP
ncbi:MAG: hypothetical protein M3P10_04230 [Actinomycetota bacterium]|nr:hypothetical protein [Actinomycetota bacterium]